MTDAPPAAPDTPAPVKGLELLARPCPACDGQLVRINGCGCGCRPVSFCLAHDCTWVDPANRPPTANPDRLRTP